MVLSHLLMICQKVLFLALVVEKTLLQLLLILQVRHLHLLPVEFYPKEAYLNYWP